jgi:hypothetical protein
MLDIFLVSRIGQSVYGLDDRAIEIRYPTEAKKNFPVASVCRSALGPTQPPIQ